MANRFNESKYHLLESYIESGSKGDLSDEDIEYLEMLTAINSMRRKYGQSKTIKFIQGPPYYLSLYRAKECFHESINLFYSNEAIDKKAMRSLKAEQLEQAAELVMATAKTPQDLETYGKLIKESAIMRQLDQVDPPEIPSALWEKPVKIYSLQPKTINLPTADRNKLAERIDTLHVPEKDKIRFKQEAQVETVDFIQMMDGIKKED